ncbi:MAG TPA: ATPase domain-containing protein [Rhodothermales bacterium]|nr:ATPase domain-containing protein [Rhodothermales bacterium]
MELTTFSADASMPDAPVSYSPLLPTGVEIIDRVWGGLYRGGSYLLYGRGASGRDLITLRFVQTGAALGDSCLFISTARPKDLMIQAASIGFDLREAYEQEKVKLLRVPPTLAHQGGEDVGVLRAMRDLVALIRQHRPQRLVVNDFMPFVMFRSYDRLRASIVDLLEQTDVLDMTMILMMSEPGNDQSRRIVDFVGSQMTGAIHLEMVSEDPESTLRRMHFMPNIGHVRGRRSEPWDLSEMLQPASVPITSERRMLPAPPRPAEPPAPRYRGIRLSAPTAQPAPAAEATPVTPIFRSAPTPAPAPAPSFTSPAPSFTAPTPAPPAPAPAAPPPEPTAFAWPSEPAPRPAESRPTTIYTPTPTPEPPVVYPTTPEPTPRPAPTARAALRPGATSLRSGSPRQAEMLPEIPTFGGGEYDDVTPDFSAPAPPPPAPAPPVQTYAAPSPAPVMPEPVQVTPIPMPPQPMPPVTPQPMPSSPYGAPATGPYAPYAEPVAPPMPANPYAAPHVAPAQATPYAPPVSAPAFEPSPYGHAAPIYEPTGMAVRTRAEVTHDRGAFARLLDEQFRLRNVQGTPFLLVAMRIEQSGSRANPFGFEFVTDLMTDALRAQDAMLADPHGERLVALLPGAQPEEAGALFTRFKARLREEAPGQAETLLNMVSAIVLRNGEATTGEAFRNADAVLAYVLDNG